MEKIVVDTDIIIDYLAGVEEAAILLDSIRAEFRFTTSVNCMEALQGARADRHPANRPREQTVLFGGVV